MDLAEFLACDMGIDLSGSDAFVAQKLLDGAQVYALG